MFVVDFKAVSPFPPISLLLSGDIESNPGPRERKEKPDPKKVMADKLEEQESKLAELSKMIQSQADLIQELRNKQVEAEDSFAKLQVESEVRVKEIKDEQEASTTELRKEISDIKFGLSGVDSLGQESIEVKDKLHQISRDMEDMQEKIFELDKSVKNNLVFYGIRCDAGSEEDPIITEAKVREVLTKQLQVTREVPIQRIRRIWNGPDIRGSKPIIVCFEKWQDKEDVLRKSKLLRGSSVFIGEDFSKKIKDQRAELMRFMRKLKKKRPKSKFSLKYDKLFVDKDVYAFNEMMGSIEQLRGTEYESACEGMINSESLTPRSSSISPVRRRRRKKSESSLKKSYSTESSLNSMVSDSPIHPKDEEDDGDSTANNDEDSDNENSIGGSLRKSNPNIPETIPE